MHKFVILTTQRTGSTYLWRCLDSHPSIASHGEMFLPSVPWENSYSHYVKANRRRRFEHLLRRRRSVNAYLADFFVPYRELEAAGFKLMYDQIRRYPDLWKWIFRDDVHVLHLVRKNTLKLIVSREAARIRKQYHSTEGPVRQVRFRLTTKKIARQIGEIEGRVQRHRDRLSKTRHLEVCYEDLFSNQEKLIAAILAFLGVETTYVLPR